MYRSDTLLRQALIALSITAPFLVVSSVATAQVVAITVAPPPLPVYEQPPIPGVGYIWTPGYWAYGPEGYYWVPGTWVRPPSVGLLWTPGYWAWRNGVYAWNAGYWGPRVGYYGGVNYGYGYVGSGYAGGYWSGSVFSYNRAVNNFGGVTVVNAYSRPVIVSPTASLVSYNGGVGGLTVKPTPQQVAFGNQQHIPATAVQMQHQTAAGSDKAMLATTNNGRPAVAATTNAGQLTGTGVVGTKILTPPGGGGAAGAPGAAGPGAGGTGVNALSKTNTNTGTGINNALPKGTLPKGNALSNTNTNLKPGTSTNTPINALPKTKSNTLSNTNTGTGIGINKQINALPKATGLPKSVGPANTNINASSKGPPRAAIGAAPAGGAPKALKGNAPPSGKGLRP